MEVAMKDTKNDQLNAYLRDAHSIELQALAQLRTAPHLAADERIAEMFRAHLAETEMHERLVRGRLEARGATPSALKDGVMAAGGKGFVLFARIQPDTPGKLVTHAYSYEHLEQAGYAMLAEAAHWAGDDDTTAVARRIQAEEARMGERLAQHFEDSLDASVGGLAPEDLEDKLVASLADAHALESQTVTLLDRAPQLVDDPALASEFDAAREQSERHRDRLEARLDDHGARPSRIKDAALRLGGFNWSLFFQAQPDSPAKLTAFAYAVEHLKIGGNAHLQGLARRAGDHETVVALDEILADERRTAAALESQFGHAVNVSLGQPA
jgi:ferritin-like metal-binding protein YciE